MAAMTRKYVESSRAPANAWATGEGSDAVTGAFPESTLESPAGAVGIVLAFGKAFPSSGVVLSAGSPLFPIHSQVTLAPIANASTIAIFALNGAAAQLISTPLRYADVTTR
jgi:hypothetical protein